LAKAKVPDRRAAVANCRNLTSNSPFCEGQIQAVKPNVLNICVFATAAFATFEQGPGVWGIGRPPGVGRVDSTPPARTVDTSTDVLVFCTSGWGGLELGRLACRGLKHPDWSFLRAASPRHRHRALIVFAPGLFAGPDWFCVPRRLQPDAVPPIRRPRLVRAAGRSTRLDPVAPIGDVD